MNLLHYQNKKYLYQPVSAQSRCGSTKSIPVLKILMDCVSILHSGVLIFITLTCILYRTVDYPPPQKKNQFILIIATKAHLTIDYVFDITFDPRLP